MFFTRKTHALTDKDTIVLADFTNTTGETVFDGALRQGLSVQLEQSPFLSIITDSNPQTLGQMGQAVDAKLTPSNRAGALPADGEVPPSSTVPLRRLALSTC